MSKLSLHIAGWLDPEVSLDLIRRAQPAILKVYDDAALEENLLRRARELSPDTLFIGRAYIEDQVLDHIDIANPGMALARYDPSIHAKRVFDELRPVVDKLGGLIDVWEGLNEIVVDRPGPLLSSYRQMARAYSRFTVALAELIHSTGQKYAAYSFPTGHPNHIELWDTLAEGLKASDYLAIHEYMSPTHDKSAVYMGM